MARRSNLRSTSLFLLALLFTIFAWSAEAQPTRQLAVLLIRDALTAVNHANWTGNYTVLRDYAAPSFREANDPARLTAIFRPIRAQGLDLSAALVVEPQITVSEMTAAGRFRLAGFIPGRPLRINFDMSFEAVDGRWRLFSISVQSSQPEPQAPPAEAGMPNSAAGKMDSASDVEVDRENAAGDGTPGTEPKPTPRPTE